MFFEIVSICRRRADPNGVPHLLRTLHLDSTSAVGDIHVFQARCNTFENMLWVISDKQKYISLIVVVVVGGGGRSSSSGSSGSSGSSAW